MSDNQTLENSLAALHQPEPHEELNEHIKGTVKKLLALENYYNADSLLRSEYARLDAPTRLNLQTGMSALREQYGNNFEEDYANFIAQKNAAQIYVKHDNEHQR